MATVQEEVKPPENSEPALIMVGDTGRERADIDDQLQYLLNRTVRRNNSVPDYSGLFIDTGQRRAFNEAKIARGDSVQREIMSYVQVMKKRIELKNKFDVENKHWWTFADVVPTWEENIERVMSGKVSGDQNEYLGGVLLNDGARCIMGESWGTAGWSNCRDCEWLGGLGLNLFAGRHGRNIDPHAREGYEEYKIRYEYHWNKYHYDVGATHSRAPNLDVGF